MRFFLISLLLVLSSPSWAGLCKDSDKGLNPEVAGKVIYSLGDKNCLGDTCYSQVVKEYDRCLDSERLLEFACSKGQITETEIRCSPGQRCVNGACRKK